MRAVILDRDGTVIEDRGYITAPGMVRLIPGAAPAIAGIRALGWKVFMASNQAAVAKGLITEDGLQGIHRRMVAVLEAEGAQLDGVYFCPHHPEGTVPGYAVECACRKPRPGLLVRAAREHGLELSRCVMIGDSRRDIEAGKAAGARTVLVLTGSGARTAAEDHGADHVVSDLPAAARWLERIRSPD